MDQNQIDLIGASIAGTYAEKAAEIVRGEFSQICSYCGWESKKGNSWEELQAHIRNCNEHPLTKANATIAEQAAAIKELRAALDTLRERIDPPPASNCSCHISPPCSDCVEYSGIREALEMANEALTNTAKWEK